MGFYFWHIRTKKMDEFCHKGSGYLQMFKYNVLPSMMVYHRLYIKDDVEFQCEGDQTVTCVLSILVPPQSDPTVSSQPGGGHRFTC